MSLLNIMTRIVRHGSTPACRFLSKQQPIQVASFTSMTATTSKLTSPSVTKFSACSIVDVSKRFKNTYEPYTDTETPSPYKDQPMHRIGYKYKYYTGGMLPRPDGEEWQKPLSFPKKTRRSMDSWTKKKALFGQNDYIDILGDGDVKPWQLIKGPAFLRGWKGNEMQRLIRRMKFEGRYLKEEEPKRYHEMKKQIWYLYKKHNQRRIRSNFWGRGAAQKCRIFKY